MMGFRKSKGSEEPKAVVVKPVTMAEKFKAIADLSLSWTRSMTPRMFIRMGSKSSL